MTPIRNGRGLALTLPIALAGCVGGLLGGGRPVPQYRFGGTAAAMQPAPRSDDVERAALALRPVRFAAEIDGDRILTATGTTTAYLKDARWIAAAPSLFGAALRGAIRDRAPAISLAPAAEGLGAGCSLDVEVMRFEADYAQPGSAPSIVIQANAFIETSRRGMVASRSFRRGVPASANSVSAVVAAFDRGSDAIVQDIAGWLGGPGTEGARSIAECRTRSERMSDNRDR